MRNRQGGVVLWTLFIVVMIIFTSGAVAVYTVFLKPSNSTKVPLFRERPITEAVAEAESLGLIVQVEPVASSLPEGRVLAQSPEAGEELRKGQVIVLQVAGGGELHAIPNVTGKTLAKAQDEIKSQGFSLGDVIRINQPNAKPGTVIAQSPSAPAKVASGRRIDLLVQEGTPAEEVVTIPDVNRMTEQEARSVIEGAGLKVQAVDRVYSPLLPEGLAIETRPGAGGAIRAGQGVILKLATQRRPAGFMDADTTTTTNKNGTATRASSQQTTTQPAKAATTTPAQNPARPVTVSVAGQEDVFIGDDYAGSPTKPGTGTTASRQTSTPASTQTPAQTPTQTPASSGGSKTARIRYTVPPIVRPMTLRIELTDPAGKRDVLNRQVRSGETINTTARYSQECVISIYLDNEFVWQERQK